MNSTRHPGPRRGEPADCRVSVGVHAAADTAFLSAEWELFHPGEWAGDHKRRQAGCRAIPRLVRLRPRRPDREPRDGPRSARARPDAGAALPTASVGISTAGVDPRPPRTSTVR
ncbi:hypothetical protein [Streptomyces europaeiscabiei]|uniref:hypothetical protein n=1 Tax=Streptomyces europaeiscabiei TaxID=146819 RepID=UPI0038D3599C